MAANLHMLCAELEKYQALIPDFEAQYSKWKLGMQVSSLAQIYFAKTNTATPAQPDLNLHVV